MRQVPFFCWMVLEREGLGPNRMECVGLVNRSQRRAKGLGSEETMDDQVPMDPLGTRATARNNVYCHHPYPAFSFLAFIITTITVVFASSYTPCQCFILAPIGACHGKTQQTTASLFEASPDLEKTACILDAATLRASHFGEKLM